MNKRIQGVSAVINHSLSWYIDITAHRIYSRYRVPQTTFCHHRDHIDQLLLAVPIEYDLVWLFEFFSPRRLDIFTQRFATGICLVISRRRCHWHRFSVHADHLFALFRRQLHVHAVERVHGRHRPLFGAARCHSSFAVGREFKKSQSHWHIKNICFIRFYQRLGPSALVFLERKNRWLHCQRFGDDGGRFIRHLDCVVRPQNHGASIQSVQ